MTSPFLSIVIPVSRDMKIKECIESIDADVEIVVVLNNQPSPEVVEIVRRSNRCKEVFVEGRGCNLARVFNLGIEKASSNKILLMNSDCVFPPALIRKVIQGLDRYDVVKARVAFDYTTRLQHLVAKCRRLFHFVFDDGKKLFGPGLAFNRSIRREIGGYFFDEEMFWGEDGELSTRIRSSGLNYFILDDDIIHGPESVNHDLIIAYRIGRGNRIREKNDGVSLGRAFLADLWHFFTDHHGHFRQAYKNGGWALVAYLFAWKLSFHLGYYTAKSRQR
jgi:glycosyltransferase involved in cell wall biosynthesis